MGYSDKKKQREYQRKWHQQNRKKRYSDRKERRLRNQLFLAECKSRMGCRICGETHPGCLNFHHKDAERKTRKLTEMAARYVSLETLENEMEKCEVLCANCHRKLHWRDCHAGKQYEINGFTSKPIV